MSGGAADSPAALPVERACLWLSDLAGEPLRPALRGEETADVAIVGGGFTGLWTALFLTEQAPERHVVLLEAERIAYGASGRNAGMIGETFDHSHSLAVEHFGLDEARRLAALARQNLDEMEAFLTAEVPEAAFTRSGQLVMALHERHLADLDHAMASARAVGVGDWRLLSAAETRAEMDSPSFVGGLLQPRSATVHPSRLATGLARVLERRGVRIHEKSAVTAWRAEGDGVVLETAGGRVRTRRAVLGANAYSGPLAPSLRRHFLPLYDYVVATEPLTDDDLAALRWPHRRSATDARSFFKYWRLSPDRRLVWGTSDAVYHGEAVGPAADHSPAHYDELSTSLQRTFPQLRPLRFPFAWGGPICSTTRFTPFFGTLCGGRVAYGLGYTGHGVGTTRVAGRILSALALDRRSDLLDLSIVRRKPLPFPPGPLRRWAIERVRRDLRRVDEGAGPSWLLRLLDLLGVGLSS